MLNYARLPTETTRFGNRFLAETGPDNTYCENETFSVTTIVGALALKLGFIWRHKTDAPAGSKKTDKLTTVNLVYSF